MHHAPFPGSIALMIINRVWFNVILEEGNMDLVTELVPVVMDRISLIYGIPEYQKDIKRYGQT